MFHPVIYLGCFVILIAVFFCVQTARLERLTLAARALILIFAVLDAAAHAEDVRDASGKPLTRSVRGYGFETVRDAGTGKVKEVKETRGRVTTVRDPSGKVLRTERR